MRAERYAEGMIASVADIAPAVWEHAVEVFGSKEKATGWLNTPLAQLQERTPAQVLLEDPANDAVETLLVQIEYVVYS